MPALTNLTDDWDIDYVNKLLQHKDMTIAWDGNDQTSAALNDYVYGITSGARGKVIGGTTASASATGTYILTNVKGRFVTNEALEILDQLPFDTVVAGGFDNLTDVTLFEASAGTAQIAVKAVEFNHPSDTAGDGTLYGLITVASFTDEDELKLVSNTGTTVATVDGAEVLGGAVGALLVDEDTNGTGTAFSNTGILSYDAGTVDIPNDALVLAGERATGVLTYTGQPSNNDTVVLGSTTYTYKTTLTGAADEVFIGASNILTMRNLANAINFGAGIGTTYGLGTVKNTLADISVTAALTLEARTFIPSTTATTSTVTGGNHSWTAATLDTGASGSTGRGRSHARTLDSITATGSYIVNDIDGTFTENEPIFIDQILNYDTLEAGQSFAVGDVVQGQTSGAQGRVIAVTATRLILAEQLLRFEEDEAIHTVQIDQSTTDVADVDFATGSLGDDEISAVTINMANSQPVPRIDQKDLLQGGLLTDSLNPVRHVRQLYNFLQDTFDEFDQMDDTIPMSGQVKNAQYTVINSWFIPDLSMRFLDSGSIRDANSDNIWGNPQSLGSMEAVGNTGFGANAVQPQLYVEQDGIFTAPSNVPSIEGHINYLIKIKSNTNPKYTATGDGGSIDSGRIRVYNRFFLHTFSHFFTANNDTGGVITIALATSNDLNNITETYDWLYDNGAGTWLVGEEIVNADAGSLQAVGVVVSADTGATGNFQYVLKSVHQFATNDVVTGQQSQVSKDADTTLTDVVAGYSDDIGFGHVDSNFTGGTVSGTYQIGEGVTSDDAGSPTGIILEVDGSTLYIDELTQGSAGWDAASTITGDLSGATYTSTGRAADTVAPKDIGDEVDNDYTAIFALDKTTSVPDGSNGATIQQLYEYTKYITSKEADSAFQLMGARNQDADVEGRLYRKVDQVTEASPAFAEQVDAPYGIKAGALFLGAQSVFVQDMASADIQNYNLIDDAGTSEIPPNLQNVSVSGLADGDKSVTYRTTGVASTTILTTEFQVGTVGGGNNQAADALIDLDTQDDPIPMNADTPPTGTLRVIDPNNAGLFLNFTYGSRNKTSGIFTLDTTAEQPTPDIGDVTSETDFTTTDDAYVVLLSTVASGSFPITVTKQIEFAETLDIMTRVRKRGILPFEVTGQFTSSGASIAAIRTTDPVVDPV